jgi:UDP-sugar transporter A1/2/3
VLRSATARPPRSLGNQGGGSCMVMTQADRLKWIALSLLVFQNGITPLILRFAMSEASSKDRFDTGQAVLVQEAMKVGLSIVLLLSEAGSVPELAATLRKEVVEKPADTLKLAVPAVLYFIQNVMMQLGSANLPAAVFGVTYQGRTLVVAFTCEFPLVPHAS